MVLDYSMMQWVLSIVLGLSYSRFINTITLLARKRRQIKFDFMLINNLVGMIAGITHFWFRSLGFFALCFRLTRLFTDVHQSCLNTCQPNPA